MIQTAIANSQTLEEVARLEKALKLGQLPSDIELPGVNASENRIMDSSVSHSSSSKQSEGTSAMEED